MIKLTLSIRLSKNKLKLFVLGVMNLKVRKIITLIGILIITSIYSGCKITAIPQSPSKHSWVVISESEAVFSKNIGGFFSKKYGITVGFSGKIHYTKDGGKTWKKGNNSSLCLFGLSIVNSKVAYACGNGSSVIKTTDGGANWKRVSGFGEYEPNQPRFLSFVNEDTGWIATPNKFKFKGENIMLGSTNDGGKTWNNIVLPQEVEEIVALYLRTPENGYVIDNKSNLYITDDGGKSFIKQPININDANLSNARFEQYVVFKFSDENNAFIAYEDKDLKFRAARSSDGGKTWVNDTVPDLSSGALYLSPDEKFITLTTYDGFVKVLEHK